MPGDWVEEMGISIDNRYNELQETYAPSYYVLVHNGKNLLVFSIDSMTNEYTTTEVATPNNKKSFSPA
jgi:hypothetical protein